MAKKKAANTDARRIKELEDYISLKQRVLDGLNALSAAERKFLSQARKELKQLKEKNKVYQVHFFSQYDAPKLLGIFKRRKDAVPFIKQRFLDMLDTGDRLRRVLPNIYVLEEDHENTGVRATAHNYDEFYYWKIEEVG